ncbi:hypothetical protein MMC21_003794 [Puttea exsequens]|nr:hypothetical protein [Puttea exsequens]
MRSTLSLGLLFVYGTINPALSLPTNETSVLEKRSYPWVGSFHTSDCSGTPVGDRPKIKDKCIAWQPAAEYVGVNFGSMGQKTSAIAFYMDGDTNCWEGFNSCTYTTLGGKYQCFPADHWKGHKIFSMQNLPDHCY